MKKTYDYLIVGQGLAGTLLAHELIERGAKIFIVDQSKGPSSSKIAAGIFNPITGKRFVKTWFCDEIYPELIAYYKNLELKFNQSFLHETPIFRPIDTIKEQNQIIELCDKSEIEPFAKFQNSPSEIKETTNATLGGLISKIGGWLDVPVFLETMKKYFIENEIYSDQLFNYSQINLNENSVSWQEMKFQKIIFCEGYSAINNPHFNWLPFNAVKGETINIKASLPVQNFILLKGIFLVNLYKNNYKVGATYNWTDKINNITDEARNEIVNKLKKIINIDFEITSQLAGIRPSTIDRRPFLGLHPQFSNLGIFNGLGTKGVSLGPYFAQEFADFLIKNSQLNAEVNINRFSSLYLSFERNS